MLLISRSSHAQIEEVYVTQVVDAIYQIEGGSKAKVPYGILSVKVRDAGEARRVCGNTVRNTYGRWVKAGRPGSYLEFLADRYCPKKADPKGNGRWKKNIKALIGEPSWQSMSV